MLNTAYELGWRDAAEGNPSRLNDPGYRNGYRDAIRNGYAIAPTGALATPAERPKAKAKAHQSWLERFFS